MGAADRTIRILAGTAIGILFFAELVSGVVALVLGIVAAAFIITSLVGWCPAYDPFGFSTRKRTSGDA